MGKMDIGVVVKGGEELVKLNPKQYEKVENKIVNMICGLPGVGSVTLSNEPDPEGQTEPDIPPWNGQVRIIIENGEHLDEDAYYDLLGKIRDLVKETVPQVTVCTVEAWGEGYYYGNQLREAIAAVLKERDIIGRFASAARKTRNDEVLPDGMGVLKIKVPQAWLDFIDEFYNITGNDRDEDLKSTVWASIEGFMLGSPCDLSPKDRDRLVEKYGLQGAR